jgi:transcriptional regulator with XRE-family HTH domain
MTIGERLREVREYLCVTEADAASRAGVGTADLAAIETGARQPNDLELQRLSRVYGHPTSYFSGVPAAIDAAGRPRLTGDLTDNDRAELDRFTAYLRDTADC